jgi:hypothetical protein
VAGSGRLLSASVTVNPRYKGTAAVAETLLGGTSSCCAITKSGRHGFHKHAWAMGHANIWMPVC